MSKIDFSIAKIIGKAIMLSSIQVAFGSVEMSSRFSVLNFSKEQDTLQNEQVLDKEITDLVILKRHLVACLATLSKQLRERKCLCTKLRIKIRYADFNTFSKEKKLQYF